MRLINYSKKFCGFILILIVLFLIINIKEADAFLVSPSKIEFDFQPNQEVSSDFIVFNRRNTTLNAIIFAEGYLNNSFKLSKDSVRLLPEQGEIVNFKIDFPNDIKPGIHQHKIIVVETFKQTGSGIGAKIALGIIVNIKKPYPGKYLETQLKATDVKVDEPVEFIVTASNFGLEDLENVQATIDIFDSDDKKIGSVKTDSKKILSKQGEELKATWNSLGNKAAVYTAKAIISYDGLTTEATTLFRLGDILIEILNITNTEIEKDTIDSVNVEIQSKWNGEIRDIHAELDVKDINKKVIMSSKSETIDLGPWQTANLQIYIDAHNVEKGDYEGNVVIFYEGRTTEKEFIVTVKEKINLLLVTSILIIVILIILIIALMKRKTVKKINDKKTKKS